MSSLEDRARRPKHQGRGWEEEQPENREGRRDVRTSDREEKTPHESMDYSCLWMLRRRELRMEHGKPSRREACARKDSVNRSLQTLFDEIQVDGSE